MVFQAVFNAPGQTSSITGLVRALQQLGPGVHPGQPRFRNDTTMRDNAKPIGTMAALLCLYRKYKLKAQSGRRPSSILAARLKVPRVQTTPDQHEGPRHILGHPRQGTPSGKPRGSRETPRSALTPAMQELAYGEG